MGSTGRNVRYGSIPAPAGEPPPPRSTPKPAQVYPRACGGTGSWRSKASEPPGLSPRLRGNPLQIPTLATATRSIPAPAGEPLHNHRLLLPLGVYPRACGGTGGWESDRYAGCGLSPRLRGNRSTTTGCSCHLGSIPAPAGEPEDGNLIDTPAAVYPRACGGTAPQPPAALSLSRVIRTVVSTIIRTP